MLGSFTMYTRPDENGEWKAPELSLSELTFSESNHPVTVPSSSPPPPLLYLQDIVTFDRSSLFEVYPSTQGIRNWNNSLPWYATGSVFYYNHERFVNSILKEQYPVMTPEMIQAGVDEFFQLHPDSDTVAARASRESIMNGHLLTSLSILYSFFICQELPIVDVEEHTRQCSNCRLLTHRLHRYTSNKAHYLTQKKKNAKKQTEPAT